MNISFWFRKLSFNNRKQFLTLLHRIRNSSDSELQWDESHDNISSKELFMQLLRMFENEHDSTKMKK